MRNWDWLRVNAPQQHFRQFKKDILLEQEKKNDSNCCSSVTKAVRRKEVRAGLIGKGHTERKYFK